MKKGVIRTLLAAAVLVKGVMLTGLAAAAVLPPPVNQMQGIPDGVFNNLEENVCRSCHNQNPPAGLPVNPTYLPDRHHLNVNTTIPANSDVPNPDPDGDGVINTVYECLSCHSLVWDDVTWSYVLDPNFRDCMICHQQNNEATVHHLTQLAADQDCQACHGSLINNPLDGHYVPTYSPSLVTPWPSGKPNGDDTIVNAAGTSPGNCNYCHNTADGLPGTPTGNLETTWIIDPNGANVVIPVYQNVETHHSTGLAVADSTRCSWCHDTGAGAGYAIRQCEACHGVTSLHNIVWDGDGDGNVMPGAEPAGYSHTGAQADCWGCHGNNGTILAAPGGGPAVPALYTVDNSSITAGANNTLALTGANFTNYVQNPWTGNFDMLLESVVRLTDADGNATDFVPTTITADGIEVVIPNSVPAGNYKLTAAKGPNASNPLNLSVTPGVVINSAECRRSTGVLTVTGSGFGTYLDASDSSTSVEMNGEAGVVQSWADDEITAEFDGCSRNATTTVTTVYDAASSSVRRVR